MENIGFRMHPLQRRADSTLLKRVSRSATPLISDNMNRIQGAPAMLLPFHRSRKILGSAFTVKTRSGDNLMVHKAIDTARPGDVIVVDAGGDQSQAIIGEIMLRLAKKNGLAGFVIYGAIRDSAAFLQHDFPCFATSVTHRGPFKEGPGEINVPISLGSMVVNPGDIIFGDVDGIVSIPLEHATHIITRAEAQEEKEQRIFTMIEQGNIDRSWVDEVLHTKGCDIT